MPPAKSSHRPVAGLSTATLLTTLSVMMPKRPPATRRGCSGPAPSRSQLIAATTSGTPPTPGKPSVLIQSLGHCALAGGAQSNVAVASTMKFNRVSFIKTLQVWRASSSPIGDHDEKITDIHSAVMVDISRAACRRSRAWSPPAHHCKQVTHVHKSILGDIADRARRPPPAPIGHGTVGSLDASIGDQFTVVNPQR